jgi:hypothetical protein
MFTTTEIEVINQVPSTLATNNIAAAQAGVVGAVTLVSSSGAGITVGASTLNANTGQTVTGLLAIDGATASVGFGDVGFQTLNAWDARTLIARNIRITSAGNDSAATATIKGFDIYGTPMTETQTLTNASVTAGKKAFKYIQSVTLAGTLSGGNVSVGTGDVIGLPLKADQFGHLYIIYNNAVITAPTGQGTYTAPDATSPATATTGDVRGSYTLASASDGTKRLQVFVVIPAYNVNSITGLFGVTQFS